MDVLIASILLMGVVVFGLGLGVIFGRKPLAGSCGGMGAIGMDGACDVCGGDKNKCEKESKIAAEVAQTSGTDFYDASKR